jgi:hypothetical protein
MEVDVYNKNDTNVYHIATAGVEWSKELGLFWKYLTFIHDMCISCALHFLGYMYFILYGSVSYMKICFLRFNISCILRSLYISLQCLLVCDHWCRSVTMVIRQYEINNQTRKE